MATYSSRCGRSMGRRSGEEVTSGGPAPQADAWANGPPARMTDERRQAILLKSISALLFATLSALVRFLGEQAVPLAKWYSFAAACAILPWW